MDGSESYYIGYDYDLDGIRTKKSVTVDSTGATTTHEYITQNGKIVRETIGSGANAQVLDFIYDASGRPFALKYTNGAADPVTYYYVLNLQGDVVGLTDVDGVHLVKYSYTAWGQPIAVTDADDVAITDTAHIAHVNPLRYRGYYYDSETGFYYLQSRYYDPTMHRFINADSYASTGQGILGHNMFAYCNNSPIISADNNGDTVEIIIAETELTIYLASYEVTISYTLLTPIDCEEGYEVAIQKKPNGVSINASFLDEPITISFSGTSSDDFGFSVDCSTSISEKIEITSSLGVDSFCITLEITDDYGNIHQVGVTIKPKSAKSIRPRLPVREESKSWVEKFATIAIITAGCVAVVWAISQVSGQTADSQALEKA